MAEYMLSRPHYYSEALAFRVINVVFGIIQGLLVIRFVLELLGANPTSQFVAWMYGVTAGLVAPFAGAFPALNLSGFVIDLAVIFAMIGYAIISWLIIRLLSFLFSALSGPVY